MMKTPTFNSLGPSHSRPAAGIPKRETAIYEDDRTVLTVIIGDGNQSIRCHMQCLPPSCRQSAESEVKFKRIIFSTGKTLNPEG